MYVCSFYVCVFHLFRMILKFSNTTSRGSIIYLAASGSVYDDFLKLLCVGKVWYILLHP
jgi:hypothetical protein